AVEPRTRSGERRRREPPIPRAGGHRDARRVDRDHPVAPLPAFVAILSPWCRKRRGRCKDRAPNAMSIRVSGVYLVPTSPGNDNGGNDKTGVDGSLHHHQQQQQHHHHHHHHHSTTKTVTIVTAPQRSNSLDYLNFEEKRQIIASSLSLSDFLAHGPAAAAAAAKEVAANTVIGSSAFMARGLAGDDEAHPPPPRFDYLDDNCRRFVSTVGGCVIYELRERLRIGVSAPTPSSVVCDPGFGPLAGARPEC
ncbi:hypothetical protein ALC56_13374, partial [Trachymyrmex septentrionalis]